MDSSYLYLQIGFVVKFLLNMKHELEKENLDEPIKWFSFELTRVQSYYLYVISIIGIVYFIGLLIQLLYPIILFIISLLFSLSVGYGDFISLAIYIGITSLFPLLAIILFNYTIQKLKPYLSKSIHERDKDEILWFGVLINKNQASVLFLLAILGTIYSLTIILSNLSSLFSMFDWGPGSLDYVITNIIQTISFSILGILILFASVFTISRTRKLTSHDSEKPLWFGFELEQDVRFIIYVGSIIGMLISSISIGSLGFFIFRSLIEWFYWSYFFSYIVIFGEMIAVLLLSVYSFVRIRKILKFNS